MRKVFRVFISEKLAFHHDIEAASAAEAKEKVRASFDRPGKIEPIEDHEGYTGYVVERAQEIPRRNSDLA